MSEQKPENTKPIKKKQSHKLEQKIEELTTDLQRVHADFVNYRRRSEEEKGAIMTQAKQEVISQILPVLDDLERALEHLPQKADHKLAEGIKMVTGNFKSTLKEKFGVEEIAAKGQEFNPGWHEAIEYQEGSGNKEMVTEVLKKGYKIGDLVIRPSVV